MRETYEKRKENNIQPIIPKFEPKEEDLKANLFGPPQITESNKKDSSNQKTDKEKSNNTENNQNDVDYIEEAHTYIYYKLNFSESINPRIPGYESKIEPVELIEEDVSRIVPSAPDEKIDILSNPEEKEDKLNKSQNIENNEKSLKKILDNDNVQMIPDKKINEGKDNERYNIGKIEEKKEMKESLEKKNFRRRTTTN
jgi:hypothetical protein